MEEGFDKKYNLRNGRKRPAHIDSLISEVDTVKCGRLNELGINGVDLHNNTTPSEKCIVANIHQGSNCFSELSRGRQCVANALVSILYKDFADTFFENWSSSDLDYLLNEGDKLYRHARRVYQFLYPHPTDLPNGLCFNGKLVKANVQTTFSGDNSFQEQLPFYSLATALNICFADGSGAGILVCNESAVAVCYYNSCFYIFDPHARDRYGNPCHDGSAILLSVQSFQHLQIVLRKINHVVNEESCSFDLHKIKTNIISLRTFRNIKNRFCFSGESDQCIECSVNSKVSNDGNESIISNFHKTVNVGPKYVCKSCSQTWFKHSIRKVTGISDEFLQHSALHISDIVCNTCYKYLKENKIPPCSSMNGLQVPEKPPELDLSPLEERLVAPRIPFMQLHEKPRGGQLSITGNVVNVPADVTSTVKKLPRVLTENETIPLKFKRCLSFKHCVAFERIRPSKVIEATNK